MKGANLQAEQAECLGVVRKSPISVMTRRLRRLEPLDPEAVHATIDTESKLLLEMDLLGRCGARGGGQ